MRQLSQIKAAYDWFFSRWQAEAARAVGAGDDAALTKLEEHRDTLERGVFILMFGQFEREVDATFFDARASYVSNPNWTQRRGWDTDALRVRKVPFTTKLAMVLDRNSSSYGKILDQYEIRNHCAHGGTTKPVGSLDAFELDLYHWQSQLRG